MSKTLSHVYNFSWFFKSNRANSYFVFSAEKESGARNENWIIIKMRCRQSCIIQVENSFSLSLKRLDLGGNLGGEKFQHSTIRIFYVACNFLIRLTAFEKIEEVGEM